MRQLFRWVSGLAIALLALAGQAAEPLTLLRAMDLAAERSVDASVAEARVGESVARVKSALGRLLPRLSTSASFVRNNREVAIGDRVVVYEWDYSADARAEVRLFEGQAIPEWLATRREAQAQALGLKWERGRLRLLAGRAFLGALAARKQYESAQLGLSLATASLEQASVRLGAGYGTTADVARGELAVFRAEAAANAAEGNLQGALEALAYLIGAPQVEARHLVHGEAPAPLAEMSTDDAGFALHAELGLREDVEALEVRQQAEEVRALGGWLGLLPTLTLSANGFFGRPNFRAPDGVFWTLTLNVSWTLFDYSRYGEIDAIEARAALIEAEVNQRLAERRRDLQAARAARAAGDKRVASLRKAHAAAQVVREQVALRFASGDATSLEMVEADEAWFRTEIELAVAELDTALAALDVLWAVGRPSP